MLRRDRRPMGWSGRFKGTGSLTGVVRMVMARFGGESGDSFE